MARRSGLRVRPRAGLWERLRRAVGELSALRTPGRAVPVGPYLPYRLDSTRVNYELARALYANRHDDYKLGAGFARPIVNAVAGFVGSPSFAHEGQDPEADADLEAFSRSQSSRFLRAVRNAVRDGDCYARIVRAKDPLDGKDRWELRLLPPEWVTPVVDPLTGGWQEVVIQYPMPLRDRDGREIGSYTITEVIRPDRREMVADGRAPADVQERLAQEPRDNPWGFIPIVHLRNEPEEYALYGASDLEPVEPFLRAYHDVMLFAVQGAKMFARPKVKFRLEDVDDFLHRNFSPQEIEAGRLRFDDKEIFLLAGEEDVEFVTADSGLSAITTLLKFLFFNVVDASETPEFAFGTAVQSSKASVSEQMVPFARKIRRKRGQFEEPFAELAAMYLAMRARAGGVRLDTYRVRVDWEEITPRDDRELAQTVATLAQGLTAAVESGLMSVHAAADFLREFVPSMAPWVDDEAEVDERRRVVESAALLARLRDGTGLELADGQEG